MKSLQNHKEKLIFTNESVDFWKDAQEFLDSQLPADFEDKMADYVTKKGYTTNEFRLFKVMTEDAIGYRGTIVLLKHFLK